MALHICHVVPPYILHDLAEGSDEEISRCASQTLDLMADIHQCREGHFRAKLTNPNRYGGPPTSEIVPGYVLEHISNAEGVDETVRQNAIDTLDTSQDYRDQRAEGSRAQEAITSFATASASFTRSVYDMGHSTDARQIPGAPVRAEGQPAVAGNDPANQAYDNCLKVLQFYQTIFSYDSLDGNNMPVVSSVHYGVNYQNAFWVGVDERFSPPKVYNQMIYGDGADPLFNFTGSLDVIGHEMTHAVTQFNSSLQYQGQSGALNEHLSDVFGIMIKQWAENTAARDSNWLIGEDCFMPEKKGTALRNMKHPGTAYKNERGLGGNDPQPADVDAMEEFIASGKLSRFRDQDHGGVHVFSGIPNRAFVICAEAFGGNSWEKAGQIWWKTATSNSLAPNCTFIQFADVTVSAAQELFDIDTARTVRDAWNTVGVVKGV